MIASEGAAPQVAPGVTTLGSGCQTSVSSGLGAGLDGGLLGERDGSESYEQEQGSG